MAAIGFSRTDAVPEGAVILSREEALERQTALIRDWTVGSDVTFLRHGKDIIFAFGLFSSIMTVNEVRKMFNIGNKGKFLLPIPVIVSSALGAWGLFPKLITENILLMDNKCPVCQEMKFAASQITLTMVYPFLLSGFGSASLGIIEKTFHVPDIGAGKRKFWDILVKIIKAKSLHFQALAAGHMVLILFVPYMQSKELSNVIEKLQQKTYDWSFNSLDSESHPEFS